MQEIHAKSQSVRELLGRKYTLESYQREYKWQEKQVDELLNDLLRAFDADYHEGHEQSHVEKYGHYFLGPIIVNKSDNKNDIVDGQQRLTTLTLILICLSHITKDAEQKLTLQGLVFSSKFGKKTFNLQVQERSDCLNKLYEDKPVDTQEGYESVRNLVKRYEEIKEGLNNKEVLSPAKVSLFIDWLTEKVNLVEIAASSDADAYTIFETMNDRGLRLTLAEMLKGYLLSKIVDGDLRKTADSKWKAEMDKLTLNKGEDSDAIKAWLRAHYADNQANYDRIGSEFHRWVRSNTNELRLQTPQNFTDFIMRDFVFYSRRFRSVRHAIENFAVEDSGLQCVYYLGQHKFTLQYPILLAPLVPEDSDDTIVRKLRVVATYLDILIHRYIGNSKSIGEGTMRSRIFYIIPMIRAKGVDEIADLLTADLDQNEFQTTLAPNFSLHGMNGPHVRRILARIICHIQTKSNLPPDFPGFFRKRGKFFQIEHIWHDNYDEVCAEEGIDQSKFGEPEFDTLRDNIGGLLLLPSKDNASYGDIPYAVKREYYAQQNLLASSLHEGCYKANIGFRQFVDESKLPFVPYKKFNHKALQQRQDLYRKIADQIWHPNRIHEALK